MSVATPPPGAEERAGAAAQALKQRALSGIWPRLAASLLIAGGFVWVMVRGGIPLLPRAEVLRLIGPGVVVAYAVLLSATIVLRTSRWVYLLRPIAPNVRPLRVLGIGFVGFSAIFLAPLRMGEIVRPYLIAQDGEVSFMQATGTVFAERVLDGVVLTTLTTLAMSLSNMVSPLPTSLGDLPLPLVAVKAAVYSATLLFCGLFVAMVVFYVARETAGRLLRAVLGVVSKGAATWAAGSLERIADGLRFLPPGKNLFKFLTTTAAYWCFMVGAQWTLMRGLGFTASVAQAATFVGVLGLGSVVPAGPGMFGAFQLAGFSALALFFPLDQVRGAGTALLFVAYVVNLTLSSLQFVVGFALMHRVPAAAN